MKLEELYGVKKKSKEYKRIYNRDYNYGLIQKIRKVILGKNNLKNVCEKDIFTRGDYKYIEKIRVL